ncbi:hypothetical protein PGB90_003412 [Kerria lacca]
MFSVSTDTPSEHPIVESSLSPEKNYLKKKNKNPCLNNNKKKQHPLPVAHSTDPLRTTKLSQISRKRFMSGINTFLCIFGLSRAASLFIDPYGSLKLLPAPITNMVWAIGFPSLTSSFCLLQLAFLHLTKLKFGFKLLRIEILLRSIITLHIFSSVLRAVISSLHWSTKIVVINYIFEFAFLCWALFLHASFLHIGYNSFKLLDRVPATMLQPHGCLNKGCSRKGETNVGMDWQHCLPFGQLSGIKI